MADALRPARQAPQAGARLRRARGPLGLAAAGRAQHPHRQARTAGATRHRGKRARLQPRLSRTRLPGRPHRGRDDRRPDLPGQQALRSLGRGRGRGAPAPGELRPGARHRPRQLRAPAQRRHALAAGGERAAAGDRRSRRGRDADAGHPLRPADRLHGAAGRQRRPAARPAGVAAGALPRHRLDRGLRRGSPAAGRGRRLHRRRCWSTCATRSSSAGSSSSRR